jgi:hypothetical protein
MDGKASCDMSNESSEEHWFLSYIERSIKPWSDLSCPLACRQSFGAVPRLSRMPRLTSMLW